MPGLTQRTQLSPECNIITLAYVERLLERTK
jgi:hypothetical protein